MSTSVSAELANTATKSVAAIPAALILGCMWALIGSTYLMEEGGFIPFMGGFIPFMVRAVGAPMLAALATMVWWIGFTRLPWRDRLMVPGLFLLAATILTVPHGANGMLYLFAAIPVGVSAWLGWVLLTTSMNWKPRLIGLLVAIALGFGLFTLVRIKGIDGDFVPEYEWAMKPTSESQLLAEVEKSKVRAGSGTLQEKPADYKAGQGDWPEFRGISHDNVVRDVEIATDWKANPPKTLWKHRIGPGWSSFAVVGKQLFTQEQRGENESVVCYDTITGNELWNYPVPTRFTEPIAGPGPRATPTFRNGKIYAQGASGHLVCLDAFNGQPAWTRDIRTDTGAEPPQWGFSGSPMIHKGIVSVFAGAKDKTLAGYNADTGELLWTSSRQTKPELSYCSTQLLNILGVDQLIMVTDTGTAAYQPETGKLLWESPWDTNGVVRCIQPALVDGTDLIIGAGLGVGTQRIKVARDGDSWAVTEVWRTTKFKPYYNDMVVHDGHAYGYDASMFVCVELKTGDVRWKARGYGSGQVLLLAKQGLLVILTEKGELALVEAKPGAHRELSKLKVLEGKTWNHPVIAYGKIFVRNGDEIACLELPKAVSGSAKD